MLKSEARTILSALAAEGLDYATLTPKGRQEIRDAIQVLLKLPTKEGTTLDYLELLDAKHEATCAELHQTRGKLATAQEKIARLRRRVAEFEDHLRKLDAIMA